MNKKVNLQQIQQDLANGIMVSRVTIKALVEYSIELESRESERVSNLQANVKSGKISALNDLYEDLGDDGKWHNPDYNSSDMLEVVQNEVYKRIKQLEVE